DQDEQVISDVDGEQGTHHLPGSSARRASANNYNNNQNLQRSADPDGSSPSALTEPAEHGDATPTTPLMESDIETAVGPEAELGLANEATTRKKQRVARWADAESDDEDAELHLLSNFGLGTTSTSTTKEDAIANTSSALSSSSSSTSLAGAGGSTGGRGAALELEQTTLLGERARPEPLALASPSSSTGRAPGSPTSMTSVALSPTSPVEEFFIGSPRTAGGAPPPA
ncbi:unnamed protein product, partial [Amoebophrya sp. A25]